MVTGNRINVINTINTLGNVALYRWQLGGIAMKNGSWGIDGSCDEMFLLKLRQPLQCANTGKPVGRIWSSLLEALGSTSLHATMLSPECMQGGCVGAEMMMMMVCGHWICMG